MSGDKGKSGEYARKKKALARSFVSKQSKDRGARPNKRALEHGDGPQKRTKRTDVGRPRERGGPLTKRTDVGRPRVRGQLGSPRSQGSVTPPDGRGSSRPPQSRGAKADAARYEAMVQDFAERWMESQRSMPLHARAASTSRQEAQAAEWARRAQFEQQEGLYEALGRLFVR